ncbi:MAG: thiopurine S-methyltransferase [Bacteriovoracia bacterium]
MKSAYDSWSQFWGEKWKDNDIGFHQNEVNLDLIQYGNLLGDGPILVPLCGKSKDMNWLLEQGRSVIGCELSDLACESFFKETNRPFKKINEKSFTVYKGESVELWCGDFFALPEDALGSVSGIYDRAALIALPDNLRPKYAKKISEIALRSSSFSNLLLITIEYESKEIQGPPFSVSLEEVHKIYSGLSVNLIEEQREEKLGGKNPKFSGVRITERVFSLSQLKK